MPETPKTQDETKGNMSEDVSEREDLWDADQKRRQYYYDDAYGYETFKDDVTEDDPSDDIVTNEPGGNK